MQIFWEKIAETKTKSGKISVAEKDLKSLSQKSFTDLRQKFRTSHLQKWHQIYHSKNASEFERRGMLLNLRAATAAAEKGLSFCQDTGTDVAFLPAGSAIDWPPNFFDSIQKGATAARFQNPFRSSIIAPQKDFSEKNTADNSPLELHWTRSADAKKSNTGFFAAKGGGSASKLWQFSLPPTFAADRKNLLDFLVEKLKTLGHSACPPYELVFILGGTSALQAMQALTLGTFDALDLGNFPKIQNEKSLEKDLQQVLARSQMGAQGKGKYFVMPSGLHVQRLPRHAATFFVSIGVACSAHRVQRFRVEKDGVFLEKLESNPAKFLPKKAPKTSTKLPHFNLADPEVLAKLRQIPAGTEFEISGPLLGARDSAHFRWRAENKSKSYLQKYPAVCYVGPTDAPSGEVIGSFGPTTAGRMDEFGEFMGKNGFAPLSVGKGTRSADFARACGKYQMMFAAMRGGPAAILRDTVNSVEIIDYPDLGMEAVRLYHVERLPMLMVVDSRGKDFYAEISQ